jgi:hypothetical protein
MPRYSKICGNVTETTAMLYNATYQAGSVIIKSNMTDNRGPDRRGTYSFADFIPSCAGQAGGVSQRYLNAGRAVRNLPGNGRIGILVGRGGA